MRRSTALRKAVETAISTLDKVTGTRDALAASVGVQSALSVALAAYKARPDKPKGTDKGEKRADA